MMDRDFLKLLPSLAISASSSHSPLPKTEIQIPVLKAKLASNQIIESMVLRSEPRVDTESKQGQFRFQLELQTSAGVLKLVADRHFEPGSVLLLKFDLQGRPEVVIPDTPNLKAAQLKAAVQQLLIQNLPLVDSKPLWVGSIESTLKELPGGVLPDRTLSLLNTLVSYKSLSAQNLHQWVSTDFLNANTKAELIASAKSIHNAIRQIPTAPITETAQNTSKQSTARVTLGVQNATVTEQPATLAKNTPTGISPLANAGASKLLMTALTTSDKTVITESKPDTISSEKSSSVGINTTHQVFDKTALAREVLKNYAQHYHNSSPNQGLPKRLEAVLNTPTTPAVSPTHQPTIDSSSVAQKSEVPTTGIKEMFSQKVINMLTQNTVEGNKTQTAQPNGNVSPDKLLAAVGSGIKSRLNEAFVSQNINQQQAIPLNILMYLLQTELGTTLSNRPDSVALQLQAKATRILAENQNTYSPSMLGKKSIPLGPKVTAETRMLESILGDIRTGIARSHVHILNQLSNQLLPDSERPLFNSIELPVFLPGLTETAILEIRQQDSGKEKQGSRNQKQWHFRFHVNFMPLPPCCMEIFYQPTTKSIGSLTLWFWSKDQTSLQLFNDYQEVFESSLRQKGFEITACTGKMGLPEKSTGKKEESTNMVDIRT